MTSRHSLLCPSSSLSACSRYRHTLHYFHLFTSRFVFIFLLVFFFFVEDSSGLGAVGKSSTNKHRTLVCLEITLYGFQKGAGILTATQQLWFNRPFCFRLKGITINRSIGRSIDHSIGRSVSYLRTLFPESLVFPPRSEVGSVTHLSLS